MIKKVQGGRSVTIEVAQFRKISQTTYAFCEYDFFDIQVHISIDSK